MGHQATATALLSKVRAVTDDLSIWPASTTRLPHGGLAVGGVSLVELAERFDTPAYVLDEGEVRGRCRTYRDAFPEADVLYAAKAFLSRAMVRWVDEEGLGLDVCSAGELELAVTAGFPPDRIVLHGNAKSPRDLEAALRLGVGRIVIDSPSEIARIAAAVGPDGRQKVMMRVVPGVSAGAHEKIRTGEDGQKFGLSSPMAALSMRSPGYSVSRSSNSPGCTATSAPRSPTSSPTWWLCAGWSG